MTELSSTELQKRIQEWFHYDKFDKTRSEIEQLIKDKNEKELSTRLLHRIAFGTAGLRARMGAGFTYMNNLIVIQTTQGLVEYLLKAQPDVYTRGVVIGHDHRYNSAEFALWTARVFLSKGIKVFFFGDMVCTPFVPFALTTLGCAAGIMITASHNPKDDNGYKLYWNNGCQIIPPHDASIQELILQNLTIWEGLDKIQLKDNVLVSDPTHEVSEKYFATMSKLYYGTKCTEPITYTAMHGVGTKFTARAFKTFGLPDFIPTLEQIEPDPSFPTVVYPNPEEGKGALKLAMATAEKHNSRLILANDPDADRLAVAERQQNGDWKIFTGNEIAFLLAHWMWIHYKRVDGEKPLMVNSTVSSKILSAMAKHEGFDWRETLTGFKWIGNKASEMSHKGYKTLFAFEVEIGFICGDMSLDKDGVRVAAVFGEMANHVYQTGSYLSAHLESLYHKYGYYVMKTRYFFCPFDKLAKVFNRVRTMNHGGYPTVLKDKYKIVGVRDMTTGYDSTTEDKKTTLPPTPESQMITFTFEDGSTCTLRNSGTEEKLKWYAEVNDKERKVAEAKIQDFVLAIFDDLIQPKENELKAPLDE
jgi:phosphomannomutase